MSFLRCVRALFSLLPCLLLLQACGHFRPEESRHTAPARQFEFHFDDGGKAIYFVLDKGRSEDADPGLSPDTYVFVVAGSDCMSMGHVLPRYFDGLEGRAGGVRIFILQKRFIEPQTSDRCSGDFVQADYPSQWIADQSEFIRTELDAARVNGQFPGRIAIVGISEGAEIAPILAHRFPAVTHVALIGNGGMDPFDTYRLQAEKHGFRYGLDEIEQRCADAKTSALAAERTCRYWQELQAIRHTDNLLALDIPLFIVMGEADAMVPVESAWFIRDAFAARRKTNLRMLLLPGTGHDFRQDGRTVLPYVWGGLERWMKK